MPPTSISEPLPSDVSRGSDLLVVTWLTVSIAFLFVSLRFYIRGIHRGNLGWDDFTIWIATAFAIAQSIFSTLQVQSGFGRNIHYLTPVQIQHFGLYTNISIMLLTISTGLVRISVCLFVLRLVPAIKASYRKWTWGLLTFCAITSLGAFLAKCFQCIPLSGLWNPSVKTRCLPPVDMNRIAIAQGGSAVFTDFLCVLLPIMVLRNLQANMRDKLAIFFVIGLGIFTAVAAIARTSLVDFTGKNPTWNLVPNAIWACLEQNIGIAVASMPALRQLLMIRKKSCLSHPSEPLNTRPPFNPFAGLPDSDRIRLSDDDSSTETSRRKFPMLTPKTSDIESRQDQRASLIRISMGTPPLWTERRISSAGTVEMSCVSPTPTLVERKPSSGERVRLSMVGPSWGHRKMPSADRAYTTKDKRLSMVSPLSIDKPPSPIFAGRIPQLGKFEETGLRHSRVATPEEMMSLGNPAALGYSCTIEGGTPKGTPKTSPKLPPS